MDYLDEWVSQSESNRRAYEIEGLILEVTEAIWGLMDKRQTTKAGLAEKLGTSRSNITQMLNGGRNMTLRKLADIVYALDGEINVNFDGEKSIAVQIRPASAQRNVFQINLSAIKNIGAVTTECANEPEMKTKPTSGRMAA